MDRLELLALLASVMWELAVVEICIALPKNQCLPWYSVVMRRLITQHPVFYQ
jgi:hypothetical protein